MVRFGWPAFWTDSFPLMHNLLGVSIGFIWCTQDANENLYFAVALEMNRNKLENALAPLVVTLCHNLKMYLTH